MSDGSEQKTEQPSAHKLEKARRRGQIPQSRDIPAVAALIGAVSALTFASQGWTAHWGALWREALARAARLDAADPLGEAFRLFLSGSRDLFAPILLSAALCALAAGAAQSQGLLSVELLRPDWSRANPGAGLKRLTGFRNAADALKVLLKAVGFALIAGPVVWKTAVRPPADPALGAAVWAAALGKSFQSVLNTAALFFGGLAAWDYYRQRRRWSADLRMTKQEVKEEHRELEGNPQIKSRIKSLRKKWAARRMMSQVPKADVVVTNPTHLAVAIRYRPKAGAPEVVAKGADLVAQRIREIARRNGVPLLENKPLAQLLYQKVDVGSPVPVALYQAVAEVLAFVYRTKRIGG